MQHRHTFALADRPFHFGACTLDPGRRELWVHGQMRATPPKVFDLLALLIEQRHRMVSKQELQDAVWPGQVISDSALARTVMMARRAIGDGQSGGLPIRNLHGRGYRFVAEVSVGNAGRAAPATPPALGNGQPVAAPAPGQASARDQRQAAAMNRPERTGADHGGPSTDALCLALSERADQAMAHERWTDAEALYHAADLIRPSVALQEKRLRALLPLHDPRVQALSDGLLAQAERHGDAALARRVRFQRWTQLAPLGGSGAEWPAGPPAEDAAGDSPHGATRDATALDADEQLVWAQQLYRQGELVQARAWAHSAETAARVAAQALSAARARLALAMFDIAAGDWRAARQSLSPLVALHRVQDRPVSAAQALVWHAVCQLELGEWGDAGVEVQRALDWLAPLEARGVVAPLLGCAALVLADLDRWDAVALIEQRLRAAQGAHPGQSRAAELAARGLCRWHQGQAGPAIGLLHAAMLRAAAEGQLCLARLLGQWMLRACAGRRQWRAARRVMRRLRALPAARGDLGLQASIGHALACEDWWRDRRDSAMVRLEGVIQQCPGTRGQAAARLDLAWIRIGQQSLGAARALLSDCGAWRGHAAFEAVWAQLSATSDGAQAPVAVEGSGLGQQRLSVSGGQSPLGGYPGGY